MSSFDVNTEQATFILFTFVGIYWFIVSPIQLYFVHQFWNLKQENITFFTKRHPYLVVFTVLMFNLYPLIFRPIAAFLWINGLINAWHPLVLLLENMLQTYAMLVIIRLWLLYYDFNHELQSLSLKWKSQIAKDQSSINLPWTIKYKWMGNVRILCIIAFVFACIILLIAVLSTPLYTMLQQRCPIIAFNDK